jgi:hypothetical protein
MTTKTKTYPDENIVDIEEYIETSNRGAFEPQKDVTERDSVYISNLTDEALKREIEESEGWREYYDNTTIDRIVSEEQKRLENHEYLKLLYVEHFKREDALDTQ